MKTTEEEKGNFRFRLDPTLSAAWVRMCRARKISQQQAIEAVLRFATAQDEAAQLMLLGQAEAKDDLIELVLRRLKPGPAADAGAADVEDVGEEGHPPAGASGVRPRRPQNGGTSSAKRQGPRHG